MLLLREGVTSWKWMTACLSNCVFPVTECCRPGVGWWETTVLENSYSAHQRQQSFALRLSDFSEMCNSSVPFSQRKKKCVIRFLNMLHQIHLLLPFPSESMVYHQVNIQPKLHPGPQSPWSLPLLGSRVLIWLHLKLLSGRIITSARHDFSHKRVGITDV